MQSAGQRHQIHPRRRHGVDQALYPVRLLGTPQRIVDVGTARVHRQQVADAEHLHLQVGVGRKLLREDLADKLVEVQESVVDQESNRRRHEALRMRIELMRTVQVIWRPRPLRNHLAVSHEHERVNGIKRMRSLDPLRHRRGIHALRFWRRLRQRLRPLHKHPAIGRDGHGLRQLNNRLHRQSRRHQTDRCYTAQHMTLIHSCAIISNPYHPMEKTCPSSVHCGSFTYLKSP